MKDIRIKIPDISFIAIFLAFICATNGNLLNTKNTFIYYLPFVLCLAVYLLEVLMEQKIFLSPYIIWRMALLFLFVMSTLYAINVSSTTVSIKKYILQTFVVLLISKKCLDSQENIKCIIKLCISAIVINMIYVFSTVDIAALEMGERLGISTINDAWNANSIGSMASFGILLIMYYYMFLYSDRTLKGRLFFVALLGFLGVAMILSGSRKSIILVAVALLCYIMISSKLHVIRNTVITIVIAYLIVYLFNNIPFLYDNIGYRFERFFDMLQGTGGDGSSIERQAMINTGLSAFWDRPLFGHGINCFKDIFATVGREAYAHNNYIELMVDVGIVGLLVYYAYLIYILIVPKRFTKDVLFASSLLLAVLVTDYGRVSYNDGFLQYILCIVICILFKTQKNTKLRSLIDT